MNHNSGARGIAYPTIIPAVNYLSEWWASWPGSPSIVFIRGETGTGKSRGMLHLVSNAMPHKFPRPLFVVPTRAARDSLASAVSKEMQKRLVTVQKMIRLLTHSRGQSQLWSTMIIDEAHTSSAEYYLLSRILFHQHESDILAGRKTIILLSATMWQDSPILLPFFTRPHTRVTIPVEKPFPVEIEYLADLGRVSVNAWRPAVSPFQIAETIREVVAHERGKRWGVGGAPRRLLVFLSTHKQCDSVAEALEKAFVDALAVEKYYGGIFDRDTGQGDEDQDEHDRFLKRWTSPRVEKDTILVATNIVESSLTLHSVSWIIDWCSVCAPNTTGGMTERWATRQSLIQRAGRTGRTCAGVVSRALSKSIYDHRLEEDRSQEHALEKIFLEWMDEHIPLSCMIDPESEEPNVRRCLQNLEKYGCHLPEKVCFCRRCPMDFHGSMNWFHYVQRMGKRSFGGPFRFTSGPQVHGTAEWLRLTGPTDGKRWEGTGFVPDLLEKVLEWMPRLLVLCAFSQVSSVNTIFYVAGYERTDVIGAIQTRLGSGSEPLSTVLHLYLNALADKEPHEFGKRWCMNWKTFRQWKVLVLRTLAHLLESTFPFSLLWTGVQWSVDGGPFEKKTAFEASRRLLDLFVGDLHSDARVSRKYYSTLSDFRKESKTKVRQPSEVLFLWKGGFMEVLREELSRLPYMVNGRRTREGAYRVMSTIPVLPEDRDDHDPEGVMTQALLAVPLHFQSVPITNGIVFPCYHDDTCRDASQMWFYVPARQQAFWNDKNRRKDLHRMRERIVVEREDRRRVYRDTVVREFREEVCFRPGMYGMQECEIEFYSLRGT